jgi:hypothetical protein
LILRHFLIGQETSAQPGFAQSPLQTLNFIEQMTEILQQTVASWHRVQKSPDNVDLVSKDLQR